MSASVSTEDRVEYELIYNGYHAVYVLNLIERFTYVYICFTF